MSLPLQRRPRQIPHPSPQTATNQTISAATRCERKSATSAARHRWYWPSANIATLNPLRTTVTLAGLAPPAGGNQSLTGDFVQVTSRPLEIVSAPCPQRELPIAKGREQAAPFSIDANLLHTSSEGLALEDPDEGG